MAIGGLLPVSEGLQTIFNGSTLGASYKVYTYEAGTSTPLATYPTYSDATATTNANANPTVADANGRVTMWGSGTTAYKVVVKTDADVTVKTIDSCYIMPGATTLSSKTPSEYQIAFYENVSGSYILTNSQTEDTYDFKYASTGITLGADKKFFFRDTALFVHSSADGQLDLGADTEIELTAPTVEFIASSGVNLTTTALGFGTSGGDISLTFDGGTFSGVITWMEDEDYFAFSDDILMSTAEKIYFRDTTAYIDSKSAGYLSLNSVGGVKSEATLLVLETAAALTDVAGYGQIWVVNATPNRLKFTNDAGTDYEVCVSDGGTGGSGSAGAGNQYVEIEIGGNVYKVLHDGTV